MNNTARFTEIKARLHSLGFRANRWPDLLDSPRKEDGFLRIVVHEGDDRVQLVCFAKNEVIRWEMDLSIYLPAAVFDAALNAAIATTGIKPKTYTTKLNGKATRVTIPA